MRSFFSASVEITQFKQPVQINKDVERVANDYIAMLKENNLELPTGNGLSFSISALATNYETKCQTFVSSTLLGRVTRWLQHCLEKKDEKNFRSMARSKSCADYLISVLLYESSDDKKKTFPTLSSKVMEYCRKHGCLGRLGLALDEVYMLLKRQTLENQLTCEKEHVKKNWHLYIPLLFKISNYFQEHQAEDAASRAETNRRGRGLRSFRLAPVYQTRNGYVNVDTVCLYEVYNFNKERHTDWVFPFKKDIASNGRTPQYFLNSVHDRWNEVINKTPWLRKCYFFGYSMVTDGVSVGFCVMKKKYDGDGTGEFGFKWVNDKSVYAPVDLKDTTVIGLDPGRKDLFDAYDEKGSFGCSGAEWRQISGITYAAKKRKYWLKTGLISIKSILICLLQR